MIRSTLHINASFVCTEAIKCVAYPNAKMDPLFAERALQAVLSETVEQRTLLTIYKRILLLFINRIKLAMVMNSFI